MEELKNEATELGLDFKGNISKKELQTMIDEAKSATAEDSTKSLMDKVKVIINPRDPEEKEGYIRWNSYEAQFQFDEEVEMPLGAVETLKTRGGYAHKADGSKKWLSRYLIEMI